MICATLKKGFKGERIIYQAVFFPADFNKFLDFMQSFDMPPITCFDLFNFKLSLNHLQ